MKNLTKTDFIERSRAIHGDQYDYSLVEYVNNYTKVEILCRKHNQVFKQRPIDHMQGNGCPLCWKERRKSGIYGVGICDMYDVTKTMAYVVWRNILSRCYSETSLKKSPTYSDARVCDEWLVFSNFKIWFDKNYVKGCTIDKDLLSRDCKLYSPSTCIFLPNEINVALISKQRKSNNPHPGVRKCKNRFQVFVSNKKKIEYYGSFADIKSAIAAYAKAKTEHIHQLADEYYAKGQLSLKAYEALKLYEYANK